jgi:signal transduction histidine kinase
VEIWTEAVDGGRVQFNVQDNGIGIEPDKVDRIWRMFERLHHPREYPGTGIGLSIVQRAVERMNGQTGVESRPSQGSRFWIRLPAAAPPER